MTSRAFVTGATGFIGLNIVERLARSGWDVTALHRATSRLTQLGQFPVRLVEGDVADPRSIASALPDNVDAVFHVAADVSHWSGDRERQWRTNVEGTRNVVAAALAKGARKFVHTSSIAVYGIQTGPFAETASKLGRDSGFPYQHSKVVAEDEVLAGVSRGLDAVMMNPTNVLGPYDRGNWSRLLQMAAKRRLPRIPPGGACFCDVRAVADAHIAAVFRGRTGQNYILGGPFVSFAQVIHAVGNLWGVPTNIRVAPGFVVRGAARVLNAVSMITGREPMITPESAAFLCASIVSRSDRAISELGYAPVGLETMVRDCLEWMRGEGLVDGSTPAPAS